ncbi:hypothetical protein [Neptunicoccus cionae]|uniref:hypothetical protein n=1 Tax=Neptunicoccus cionae TaxID=2035344 RepID=UPI00166BBEF8|nr:hypothetical protein [Amylibacter cionae]
MATDDPEVAENSVAVAILAWIKPPGIHSDCGIQSGVSSVVFAVLERIGLIEIGDQHGPGACVIAILSAAETSASCVVTPQLQKAGTSPSPTITPSTQSD